MAIELSRVALNLIKEGKKKPQYIPMLIKMVLPSMRISADEQDIVKATLHDELARAMFEPTN